MTSVKSSGSLTEALLPILRRPIDLRTRQRAAWHLVDWLGCALIGQRSEVAETFRRELAPETISDLMLSGRDPARLALAIGSFGSILEMDDVHRTAILHPGPVVIPAALSVPGEHRGDRFLDAVIRGYEAMIRLGIAIGPAHYRYYHNTASCGGFGSAIAAGELMGLSDAELVSALGNAGSTAGGLWQCRNEPVMTKAFHPADASRRGVQAARLAAAGLTGARFILEGPQGLFAATAPQSDPNRLIEAMSPDWQIEETSFKPWPACRHAHAVIDAALLVRDRVDPGRIRHIDIATYADAQLFCDKPSPQTETEAKFSLQHSVAVVFAEGLPTLPAFRPERLDEDDFVSFRKIASVSADQQFTDAYPRHFGARVTIHLDDGTTLTESVADALGDSENPLGQEAVIEKCRNLMDEAGISATLADRLIAQALALAEGAPVLDLKTSLAEALRPAA